MAQYEHLPIYKKAMDIAIQFRQQPFMFGETNHA
jgi:hypothetical protein